MNKYYEYSFMCVLVDINSFLLDIYLEVELLTCMKNRYVFRFSTYCQTVSPGGCFNLYSCQLAKFESSNRS